MTCIGWTMAAMLHGGGVKHMCLQSVTLAVLIMRKELHGFLFLCLHSNSVPIVMLPHLVHLCLGLNASIV